MKKLWTVYFVWFIIVLLSASIISCGDDDENEMIDYDAEFYVEDGQVLIRFSITNTSNVSLIIRRSDGQSSTIVEDRLVAGSWNKIWTIEKHPETFFAGTCFIDFEADDFSVSKVVLLKHREDILQSVQDFADDNFDKEAYFEWEYQVASNWYEDELSFNGTVNEWNELDWETRKRYLEGGGPPPPPTEPAELSLETDFLHRDYDNLVIISYYISTEAYTWPVAYQMSQDYPSYDLLYLFDSNESDDIAELVDTETVWLGLNYDQDNESWSWAYNNETLDFNRWGVLEPRDSEGIQTAVLHGLYSDEMNAGAWDAVNYLDTEGDSLRYKFIVKNHCTSNEGQVLPPENDFFIYEYPLFWYNLPQEDNLAYYWMIGVYPQVFGQFWNDQTGDDPTSLIWEGSSQAFEEYKEMLGLDNE